MDNAAAGRTYHESIESAREYDDNYVQNVSLICKCRGVDDHGQL
jgi:hypothetical protein